ncbi:MAG: D-alanyl-D-alanine carboxypeptidase [Cyclobacteriaceae bacterium]|nr:D-alanyl-D-alanine carboxypeptidase [Cyclobacteriaceae bacterium]
MSASIRLAFAVLLLAVLGCSPTAIILKEVRKAETDYRHHAGLLLQDLSSGKNLVEWNSHRYFIPASNTKVLTLYTSLRLLGGDTLPALRYEIRGDSMICWGTGDPTFLYRHVWQSNKTFQFLQQSPQRLFISTSNWYAPHLGPGWSWDDYNDYYSAERSPFPVFGNISVLSPSAGKWKVIPRELSERLVVEDSVKGRTQFSRDWSSNVLRISPGKKGAVQIPEIPFHQSPEFTIAMLSDTLHRIVEWTPATMRAGARWLYSTPADSAYRVLMQDSDNFIAEQLLLMGGMVLSDSLHSDPVIRHMKEHEFMDLPDPLHWVDGSGLSRYNLQTPANMVAVWKKLNGIIARDRLYRLLNSYYSAEPFIYGKSGSMSGNYSLSGYLITRKGRVLLFSFMNSNFTVPVREVRQRVEKILTQVRDRY